MTQTPDIDATTIARAEVLWPVNDLAKEMPFFTQQLGFRLDEIYPADDPRVAVISGHGVTLRLDQNAVFTPSVLRLMVGDSADEIATPNGHCIEIAPAAAPLVVPPTQHAFGVRHLVDSDAWVIGRAGMQYRDLIPDRLGGSIIASHIRIPDGGPVPDMVHYHIVGFQLIFCLHGWVRLVYEDQGEPFILEAGNCVIQPPQIRHRVLEASDNIEVLEIGVPAEHITTIDHEMELPNTTVNPDRTWDGTRFIHHKADGATWQPWRIPGWQARDTGIGEATGGVAGVHVAKPTPNVRPVWTSHDTDILFTFVKSGTVSLAVEGEDISELVAGDAFVLPPAMPAQLSAPSDDCELIEVTLPAQFTTTQHSA